MSVPTTIVVPGGELSEGQDASSFGAGVGLGLLLGYYATEHFGILGGLIGSTSHQGLSGCKSKDECKGARYQFPLLAQYALRSRKEGLYFQGGFGFASTYRVIVEDAGTLTYSAPFDVKVGLGYRMSTGMLGGPRDKPSRWSLDLLTQFEFGQFQSVAGSTVTRGSFDGDIARPASHYLAEFGVALHWTP